MATTTNFGWETPDDTDLVKDGALAMRTLGNAIDTSLVDLKGGTTGQVLSKTSNTDMDFTWVTSDDANAIQNAIVDAKGDLIAASAADTPARIAVGNNGETLVADSSATTGLRWNPSYQAGKNFLINGGFDIWQRGTSFNTTNGGSGYHADRWTYYAAGTGTITRSTALLRSGAEYAWRWTSTAANSNCDLYMLLETPMAVQLQGQTVTFSIYVAGTAGKTVSLYLYSSTVDNDGLFGTWTQVTPTGSSSLTSTGSYQRLTATFSVPTTTRSIRLAVGTSAMANTEFISYMQAQLEVGSTATNFSRAGGNIAGELAACQRYYFRQTGPQANSILTNFGWGSNNAQYVYAVFNTPVTMRTAPTSLDYANVRFGDGTTFYTPTTLALASTQAGNNPSLIEIYYSTGGLTQYRPYLITCNNNTAGYLGVSAEL